MPNVQVEINECSSICCSDERTAYQPKDKVTLSKFVNKGRKFIPAWWYDNYWITLCSTRKKVFCLYCRFAQMHILLTFSKKGEDAFSVRGFDNFKLKNFTPMIIQAHF